MKINFITHNEPSWNYPDIVVQDNPSKVIEMFKNTDIIGGDTENNDLNTIYATPLLSQFSDSKESYIIDKSTIDCSWLKDYSNKQILAHNGQYDYMIWKQQYGIEMPNIVDLMIIEQILGRGSRRFNNLDAVHQRRLNRPLPVPKTTRQAFTKMKFNPRFDVEHILYSGYDPYCLFEIYDVQKPLIKEYKLERRIYDIAFPLLSLLGDMCLEGFYLDEDKWRKTLRENKTDKYHTECRLDEEIRRFSVDHLELKGGIWTRKRKFADGEQSGLFNDAVLVQNENKHNVNYSSPKQLNKLFRVLREPIPQERDKKTYEFKDSFSEGALEQYKIEYPSSRMINFINSLIEYREVEKEINSFGEIFLRDRVRDGKGKKFKRGYRNSITQRVHTYYKQEFTANGRLSSGDSKRKKGEQGVGFYNSQQVPKKNKFRNSFSLSPQEILDKWKISTRDLTGAELVIFASQSQDKKLLEIINKKKDIHCYLATAAYTKVIQYILKEMPEARAYDELYTLLKANRLEQTLRKKVGTTPTGEDIFEDYSKIELDQITKDRVAKAIKDQGIIIDKKLHTDIRGPFKNVVYGILYGAQESKIAETLNIAPYYAELTLIGMEKALPDGFAYLERVARLAVKNGYMIFNTRTNSRHWFYSWLDAQQRGRQLTNKERSGIERFAKNAMMSGTQADMIKEAMVTVNKFMQDIADKMISEGKIKHLKDIFRWKLQVHDEVVFMWRYEDITLPEQIDKIITDVCNLYLADNIKMPIAGYTGVYWNKD